MQMQSKILGELLLKKVQKSPRNRAIGWIENNKIRHINNIKYLKIIEEISLGLIHVGLKKNDNIAILSSTCKEWHFCDLGILCSQGTVIPIYPSYLPEEIEYILKHSESKMIIVENNSQLEKVIAVQNKLPKLKVIISIGMVRDELKTQIKSKVKYYELVQIIEFGSNDKEKDPNLFRNNIKTTAGEQTASIIYTSGTTGRPKGAVISHNALCSMLFNLRVFLKNNIDNDDRTLTFLPLSHVLGRCDSLLNLIFGLENIYAESIDKILDNLTIVKPSIMIAVPRIFEKVYANILHSINEDNFIKKSLFDWAELVSNQYFEKLDRDLAPTSLEIIQRELAYKFVYSKIYKRFGGNIRFFVSGGAPLSSQISKFLRNANLIILEGYGLTETIAPCTLTPPSKQIPGTVGTPIGDVRLKFAEDGEILIHSAAMFSSYFKEEKETDKVFTDEWFHTGDIGQLTIDGYLKITDRKKDIIITSGGKNIAPQKIENLMKTMPYISNFMVIGDQKKYLTAVVSIEKEIFKDKLDQFELPETSSIEDLSKNKHINSLVDENIKQVNKELASFETIKKFIIAPVEFSIDNGLLTPSLKLKKKNIMMTFKDEINAMY